MIDSKPKKAWYKKWWAICIFIFIGLGVIASFSEQKSNPEATHQQQKQSNATAQQTEPNKLEKLRDNLQESKQRLDELEKVKECSKVCSGESYDIPAVRTEMYAACYDAYYNGGLTVLEEVTKGCKDK